MVTARFNRPIQYPSCSHNTFGISHKELPQTLQADRSLNGDPVLLCPETALHNPAGPPADLQPLA
jgi:hypothetical protein